LIFVQPIGIEFQDDVLNNGQYGRKNTADNECLFDMNIGHDFGRLLISKNKEAIINTMAKRAVKTGVSFPSHWSTFMPSQTPNRIAAII
jgi:hypothetical protein